MSVVFALPVLLAVQLPLRGDDAFIAVRGDQYEGAIVPDTSSWHGVMWRDPAIRDEVAVVGGWTPTAEQIDAAEVALRNFIVRARQGVRPANVPDAGAELTARDIRELADNLPRMKRQYAGLVVDGARQTILVHGFVDRYGGERWRREAIVVMGAWCRQFWMHVSLQPQQILNIRCGTTG